MALVLGNIRGQEPVAVRVHSACIPGDLLGTQGCKCDLKKRRALEKIEREGAGVFVYVHPGEVNLARQVQRHVVGQSPEVAAEGSGAEREQTEQEPHNEGLPPELRDFGLGAQVLATLGVSKIKLMTDNPKRIVGLRSFGLEVVERIPLTEEASD
jgi:3,4-dihydroxy 2-butanone 4-phosphate synthase/GTP cyclohydrolase II